jgi:uncharacterized protein (DUF934 family)
MKLIDANGRYVPDAFSREGGAAALVPFESLEAALADSPAKLGVEAPNTVKTEALTPHFARLALIAVVFPGYMDGRGFTIAKRLRNAGFKGAIRAVGPLIAEQFAYGLSCGFTEFEIPDEHAARMPEEVFQAAAKAFEATYQRGYGQRGGNILDQRRAARQEGKNA